MRFGVLGPVMAWTDAGGPAVISGRKVRAVLANLIPDATDEDWESCTTEDVERIYEVALRKTTRALAIVESRRKNGDAGSAETVTRKRSRSRRSSQTTMSGISAPE